MLFEDGSAAAGVCHARGHLGLPPVWMIYLSVGDLTESLRRAEEEGGKIIKSMQRRTGSSLLRRSGSRGTDLALIAG